MHKNEKSTQLTTRHKIYSDPITGARVDLLGVMHVAHNPHYYPDIQEILDTREYQGAQIQYELMRNGTHQEILDVIAENNARKILQRIRRIRKFASGAALLEAGLPLVAQQDHIQYRPTWRNADISLIEVAERSSGPALAGMALASLALKPLMRRMEPEKRLDMLVKTLNEDSPLTKREQLSQRVGSVIPNALKSTLFDRRNEVALQAYDLLQEEQPGRDAVLFWGEGHITALDAGLKRRGLEPLAERRFIALDTDAMLREMS